MIMKGYLYVIFIVVILFNSCENDESKKTDTTITKDALVNKYQFISHNYCSQNLLFDDHIFGNTMIQITPNNNFLKCMVINDSKFVFSCGRGKKEVVISKIKCESSNWVNFDGLILPKLRYDDDDIMILTQKAGSDSWIDYFIVLSKNTIYSEQAMYIDNENRKYVYLDYDDHGNRNVFFIIHDIMLDSRDTLKANYHKFRKDGYPALHISNVSLSYDTLFYSVDIGKSMIRDTLYY